MIKYIFLLLILSGCCPTATNLYIYDSRSKIIVEYSYSF